MWELIFQLQPTPATTHLTVKDGDLQQSLIVQRADKPARLCSVQSPECISTVSGCVMLLSLEVWGSVVMHRNWDNYTQKLINITNIKAKDVNRGEYVLMSPLTPSSKS